MLPVSLTMNLPAYSGEDLKFNFVYSSKVSTKFTNFCKLSTFKFCSMVKVSKLSEMFLSKRR
jgi:hypothetical protein